MPLAPTDGGGFGGGFGQPMAPTSGAGLMGGGRAGKSGTRATMAPTERHHTSSQMSGYRAMPSGAGSAGQVARNGMQNGAAASMAYPSGEKAFAGYRPASGVSPYMNLFRPTTGSVDNYTTLVRPELQQRQTNQQYGYQIRGLQHDTRLQGSNLQQLNRERALEGVGTPQFYQNTGSYYQGFGQ